MDGKFWEGGFLWWDLLERDAGMSEFCVWVWAECGRLHGHGIATVVSGGAFSGCSEGGFQVGIGLRVCLLGLFLGSFLGPFEFFEGSKDFGFVFQTIPFDGLVIDGDFGAEFLEFIGGLIFEVVS